MMNIQEIVNRGAKLSTECELDLSSATAVMTQAMIRRYMVARTNNETAVTPEEFTEIVKSMMEDLFAPVTRPNIPRPLRMAGVERVQKLMERLAS